MHRVAVLVGHLNADPKSAAAANPTAGKVNLRKTFGEKSRFVLRALEVGDYDKGFLRILSQLTTVGDVSKQHFQETFGNMQAAGTTYNTVVIEDTEKGELVGAASLILEQKFIHDCGKVGHVEDVVVNSTYRGQQLGARLIKALTEIGVAYGCYKIILDCDRKNVGFYAKLGYKEKGVECAYYVKDHQ